MLSSFRLANFKSYEAASLPLSSLTLLIGANAAGKSNLLEAMQLLSWLATGRRLADLSAVMKDGEIAIRGKPADMSRNATEPLTLGATLPPADDALELEFQLQLRTDNGGPRVVGEQLSTPDAGPVSYFYRIDAPAPSHSSDVNVAYNNFAKGGNKPHIACVDQQAVFTQLLTPARFQGEKARERIPAAAERLQNALRATLFLDPNPKAMRDWAFADDAVLRPNGRNVSATLKALDVAGMTPSVLDFVRALPEQDIGGIDFLTTARNEVMVRVIETFGGRREPRDVSAMSDGTLRVLAIAAAVLSVASGSLVVIEEIDNGVHPSRARQLLEALYRVAKQRDLRVLITTHNPALVDATPPAAIPDVMAVYRDSAGVSRLQRLADLEDYPSLLAQGPLGSLLTRGVIDKFLKHRRDAAERMRQGQQALRIFAEGSGREPT